MSGCKSCPAIIQRHFKFGNKKFSSSEEFTQQQLKLLVNKRFSSVLIDKDEQFITKKNDSFVNDDVMRCRMSREVKSYTNGTMKQQRNVLPTDPNKIAKRRAFYRWSVNSERDLQRNFRFSQLAMGMRSRLAPATELGARTRGIQEEPPATSKNDQQMGGMPTQLPTHQHDAC